MKKSSRMSGLHKKLFKGPTGSGAGVKRGDESSKKALMEVKSNTVVTDILHLQELETKRILLDIFKVKQQKSAEPGTIPSFCKKKPKEGSICHRVQRLAKYLFLKKHSDLLLNADDLDAMCVFLRENCVINDATGDEKCCIFLKFSFSMTFMTWPTYPTLKRVNQQPSIA
ncbi:probable serine/threonine-protein phosphatase 2a regulatory subunit b'' subunit ton2 [Phtheirospermum japonicum]|uniref:Probable serine/threonine-protein phosphatase 2a regulatory subunit b'' subunit ton2 n=1 Tax=Phtheirospermum japonicum TaxID=374723 RepID=A0A830C080_9LAMI|nr:probable serine/threonine-protein phosphatase 2a regulatory subunit b'' subunit ton2 [Phtheirospermum japonicum]